MLLVGQGSFGQGYTASLSRLRDHLAVGYGMWTVTDSQGKRVSAPGGWTLEQVEQWLGLENQEES